MAEDDRPRQYIPSLPQNREETVARRVSSELAQRTAAELDEHKKSTRHELDQIHLSVERYREGITAAIAAINVAHTSATRWFVGIMLPLLLIFSGLFFTSLQQINTISERQVNVIRHNEEQDHALNEHRSHSDQVQADLDKRIRTLEMWRYKADKWEEPRP